MTPKCIYLFDKLHEIYLPVEPRVGVAWVGVGVITAEIITSFGILKYNRKHEKLKCFS